MVLLNWQPSGTFLRNLSFSGCFLLFLSIIEKRSGDFMTNTEFVSAKAIRSALRAWHKPDGNPENLLATLILVRDEQTTISGKVDSDVTRLATNEVLLKAIDYIHEEQKPIFAQVLQKRFIEGINAQGVATQHTYTEDTVYRIQREAIQSLALTINQWEAARRQDKALELETYLEPATYTQLFGVKESQQELIDLLLHKTEYWIVSIVGLGGIGKTALADATARQIIRQFHYKQVLWIRMEAGDENGRFLSAEHAYANLITKLSQAFWPEESSKLSQQQLQQNIHIKLNQQPCLIIVDNLEDVEQTAFLIEQLSSLTKPSKFLITSRVQPQSHAPIYSINIDEMSAVDAFALMRHHAREKGIQFVHQSTEADLQAIYDTVGGNPYALKLVVSLLKLWPLADLLVNLTEGSAGSSQQLYTHIYRQIWRSLSENARLLLQALTLTSETGGTASHLQQISNLRTDFWAAMQELHQYSLVEVRGNLQEKRYGIHRLTYTFLCTEITGWDDDLV